MRSLELLNHSQPCNFRWVGIPNLTTSNSVNKSGGWPVDLDMQVTFVVQLGGFSSFYVYNVAKPYSFSLVMASLPYKLPHSHAWLEMGEKINVKKISREIYNKQ
jgi:hypothetical protein